jgi:hypothetical protein
MPLITIKSGADIPDGVYPVILAGIEGPKTITPQQGPNAGQEVEILSWKFVVLDGKYKDTEIEATSSTASGPRSKLYGFLTALFNGTPPQIGANFEASDLTGRMALATIQRSESGWPRIVNLGAVPAGMLGKQVAAATGAPVSGPAAESVPAPAGVVTPLREQVAAGAGDLPF